MTANLREFKRICNGSIVILITPSVQPNVTILADRLSHMGLRPVLILLDAISFGKAQDSESMSLKLSHLDIPVYRVKKGDNISVILSAGASRFISLA